MILIFFPAKAEMLNFSDLEKGGQKGGQGRLYFTLNSCGTTKKCNILSLFHIKIELPLAPLLAPFSRFEKSNISAFAGKKIKVIAILDQILA